MWIRTARHHFSLDKVTHTVIQDNVLYIYFVDGYIILKDEEAKQVIDYLDSIAAPTWALEVPEVVKEYEQT